MILHFVILALCLWMYLISWFINTAFFKDSCGVEGFGSVYLRNSGFLAVFISHEFWLGCLLLIGDDKNSKIKQRRFILIICVMR